MPKDIKKCEKQSKDNQTKTIYSRIGTALKCKSLDFNLSARTNKRRQAPEKIITRFVRLELISRLGHHGSVPLKQFPYAWCPLDFRGA